jgi:adenylyl-sulfate kinase
VSDAAGNLTEHPGEVSREDREGLLGQRAVTLWFTGLSGSGKSTLARALERELTDRGRLVYVLDGDGVRLGLNADLGFAPEDRGENIRRVAEVARLMNDAGIIVLSAFISPYRADRERAREIIGADRFVEIWVSTPIEVCRARDPKGLYARAEAGEIPQFTGVSAPFEEPEGGGVVVDTGVVSVEAAVARLVGVAVR